MSDYDMYLAVLAITDLAFWYSDGVMSANQYCHICVGFPYLLGFEYITICFFRQLRSVWVDVWYGKYRIVLNRYQKILNFDRIQNINLNW